MKKTLYLMRYKRGATHTTVEGIARTGQVSPRGIVAHTEDQEGRIAAHIGPSAIRYIREPDGHIRPMTIREMIDRGYFLVASGPTGIHRVKEGTNERQDRPQKGRTHSA
jgi:hypothetical protein